jgi:hypothetical protein
LYKAGNNVGGKKILPNLSIRRANMNLIQIIQSDYISAIVGGIGGVITAWLT